MNNNHRERLVARGIGLAALVGGCLMLIALNPFGVFEVRPHLATDPRSEGSGPPEENSVQSAIDAALLRHDVPLTGTVRVEGKVVPAAGGHLSSAAIGGAVVTLRWQQDSVEAATATDVVARIASTGEFTFVLNSADWRFGAAYQLVVSDADNRPLFRGYVTLGPSIDIPVAATVDYRGWFIDSSGTPLIGSFAFFDVVAGQRRRVLGGMTDAQGGFLATGPCVDSPFVNVYFTSPSLGLVEFSHQIPTIELIQGGVQIVVPARVSIVRVLDSSATPVPLATVRYQPTGDARLAKAITDNNGYARLWHCGSATDVYVLHDLLAPHHLRFAELPSTAAITVPPRAVHQVEGVIVSASGSAMDMASIVGFADVGAVDPVTDASAQTESSPDGRFSLAIPLSSNGKYCLWVIHPQAANITVKLQGLSVSPEHFRIELPTVHSVTLRPRAMLPGGTATEAPPRYVIASHDLEWYRSGAILGGSTHMSLPPGEYSAMVILGDCAGYCRISVADAAVTKEVGLLPLRVLRVRVEPESTDPVTFDLRDRVLGQLPAGFLPVRQLESGKHFELKVPAAGGPYELAIARGLGQKVIRITEADDYSVPFN